MKVAVGADHAGFELKEELRSSLERAGHTVTDLGTESMDSVDYPDFARAVAARVAAGEAERGLLVCGSGVGMAITANKTPGVRAACCSDAFSARMSRKHNDANVLAIGARVVGPGVAAELLQIFLDTPFEGGRHSRRVEKIESGG